MARKKSQTATPDGVKDFRHTDARRKNNPPAGIAPTYEVRERQATPYAYDPHLEPQLVWAGKAEHTSFEVDLVSLHVHERISTQAMLKAVRRPEPVQLSLFGETPLPADQQIEFYCSRKRRWRACRCTLPTSHPTCWWATCSRPPVPARSLPSLGSRTWPSPPSPRPLAGEGSCTPSSCAAWTSTTR